MRQRDRYFPEKLGKHVTDTLPFKLPTCGSDMFIVVVVFVCFVFHFSMLTHIKLSLLQENALCLLKNRVCVLVKSISLGQSNRFSEIFMFENRGLTRGRRLEFHPISSHCESLALVS